ncbi:hypothetical protein AAVH_26117 [Aphelenchoides avenae]|nr:hypothetical protein AAVH_26117 [Aphelenchus avenae]
MSSLSETSNAELFKGYRLKSLEAFMEFANFSSLIAKNFYRPIGQNRSCGFLPENVLNETVAPALESTIDAIVSHLAELWRNVSDDTYEPQRFPLYKFVPCKEFDIEEKLKVVVLTRMREYQVFCT